MLSGTSTLSSTVASFQYRSGIEATHCTRIEPVGANSALTGNSMSWEMLDRPVFGSLIITGSLRNDELTWKAEEEVGRRG